MNDAIHHMRIGKCERQQERYRREDFVVQDFYDDFDTTTTTTNRPQREWTTQGKFSDSIDFPDYERWAKKNFKGTKKLKAAKNIRGILQFFAKFANLL